MRTSSLASLPSCLPGIQAFARDGFIAPHPLFSRSECQFIRRHLESGDKPKPLLWEKGRFATDRIMYDLAIRPTIVNFLRELCGEDIVLWGTSVLVRNPGDEHPWHTDIESSAPNGAFVSVWIGIHNSSRASTLKLISRSHLFGKSLQQVSHDRGYRRGQASNDQILDWAREIDPTSALIQPAVSDGECIVYDGRLWHGSEHRGDSQRIALLFQYTIAGTAVFIPDLTQLEWPFRYKPETAPVVLVSGSRREGQEYIRVPLEIEEHKLSSEVHSLERPLPEDKLARWRPHHLFRGATPNARVMGAHVSVLSSGHSPHPPHAHSEEELLIVLDGEAELIITDSPDDSDPRIERLQKASFVYYPAYQHHTIRNASGGPITYLMFKWRGELANGKEPLSTTILDSQNASIPAATPFSAVTLFEGPTSYLAKLHSHVSILQPGAGYAPHADEHDVAIVVLSGRVETMHRQVEPYGVIFYAAGEMHDMKNSGVLPAFYLAFEFHKRRSSEEVPLNFVNETIEPMMTSRAR